MSSDLDALRGPTEFLDYETPAVRKFVAEAIPDETGMTDIDKAVALYYAVRDGIHYEVYGADLSRTGLRASSILEAGFGFCVHKAIVYAAAVRSMGIPCRITYGDVRNHLASDRLRKLVGGDIFRYHSLNSVYLDGKWVKATPVFNKLLCRLYQIKPLDFDGRQDSLYHPHDQLGRRHMEFLRMHGDFDDVPYERVVEGIRQAHPLLFPESVTVTAPGSLVDEADSSTTV
ncbi:transglutaminase domain-containing protein [Pseudonocardiaceae bacterium YIM PH 21723]|nr:transglutaminase domain-containing protein [Pseudonocardiaceae bacterium YIM PH 21723]